MQPRPGYPHGELAEPERRSWIGPLILLCVLGVGGYAGYYGYCRYEVLERAHAFGQEQQDLQQALLHLQRRIGPEDLRDVVVAAAKEAGVMVERGDIAAVIEPLTPENEKKLPIVVQQALGMAARIVQYGRHRTPRWLVGFRATLTAKAGPVKHTFTAERYTWFEDVLEPVPAGSAPPSP